MSDILKAITNGIKLLNDTLIILEEVPKELEPFALDLKRAELRLGQGSEGIMPTYSQEAYLKYKKSLGTYKAIGGVFDLFESGKLSKGVTATEKEGIIYVQNGPNSPDYAKKFTDYITGLSDKGVEELAEKGYIMITNRVSNLIK